LEPSDAVTDGSDVSSGHEDDCDNGVDDDGDDFTDCLDQDCIGTETCPCDELEYECRDRLDNDCDSFIDCEDEDCLDPCACYPLGEDPCPEEGEHCCHDGCCDTSSDPTCCGRCGVSCTADEYCVDGECLECTDSTQCDDENECTTDSCSAGVCEHVNRPDMTSCGTASVCCGGTCHGGDCCSDEDCGQCRGTARACSGITTESTCEEQINCVWDLGGPCDFGTSGDTCSDLTTQVECETCVACCWDDGGFCTGHCPAPTLVCYAITSKSECDACASFGKCVWDPPPFCYGSREACSTYSSAICESQLDCYISTCSEYNCS
jgi:hypothetical protein